MAKGRLVRNVTTALASILAFVLLGAFTEMDFVGVSDCESCHIEETQIWRNSPHAKATLSLGERGPEAKCRTCHATGLAPLGQSPLPAVQCEACHGPGRGYRDADIMRNPMLAEMLGMTKLKNTKVMEDVCLSCHANSTKVGPFNAVEEWKSIGHGLAKK